MCGDDAFHSIVHRDSGEDDASRGLNVRSIAFRCQNSTQKSWNTPLALASADDAGLVPTVASTPGRLVSLVEAARMPEAQEC